MTTRTFRSLVLGGSAAVTAAVIVAGCGLGYLDPSDLPQSVSVRIDNGTTEYVQVTFDVLDGSDATFDPESTPESMGNDDVGASPAGDSGDLSTSLPAAKRALLAKQSVIRVAPGESTIGTITCFQQVTVSAQTGEASPTGVTFSGAGAGTDGFDSGSVGLGGERLLQPGSDFQCSDTIIVQITGTGSGEILTVPAGEPLPDPIQPDGDNLNDNTGDGDEDPTNNTLTFQLQNGTASAVEFVISEDEDDTGEGDVTVAEPIEIKVPAGQLTTGVLPCGPTYVVSGTLSVLGEVKAVTLQGDGAGTLGFDEGSLGASGERYLVFDSHYRCGNVIVATLEDDGTGLGDSTLTDPLGEIQVYASQEEVPEPDLGGGEDGEDSAPSVTLTISNATESYVQVHFTAGSDTIVSSSFDVRVPPGSSTSGTGECARQYRIEGYHLEDVDSDDEDGFYTVVLLGAGTGAEGFDQNNVGTDNSRLLLLDDHFSCGQEIVVQIRATNNTVNLDTGAVSYGFGDGEVIVQDVE